MEDIWSVLFSVVIITVWLLMWPLAALHQKYCERPVTQDDHEPEEQWTQLSFFSSATLP